MSTTNVQRLQLRAGSVLLAGVAVGAALAFAYDGPYADALLLLCPVVLAVAEWARGRRR